MAVMGIQLCVKNHWIVKKKNTHFYSGYRKEKKIKEKENKEESQNRYYHVEHSVLIWLTNLK